MEEQERTASGRMLTQPAQLFEELFDTDEVDLGRRGVVVVRSLSRAEVHQMRGIDKPDEAERQTLARCMVSPKITAEQAGLWQAASAAGEIKRVVDKIGKLSGLDDDADKEAYKSPDADAGAGV